MKYFVYTRTFSGRLSLDEEFDDFHEALLSLDTQDRELNEHVIMDEEHFVVWRGDAQLAVRDYNARTQPVRINLES